MTRYVCWLLCKSGSWSTLKFSNILSEDFQQRLVSGKRYTGIVVYMQIGERYFPIICESFWK